MATDGIRPLEPLLDADEEKDIKAFYHNAAYKTNRVAINLEKMKMLKARLQDCVRENGVNYIDKCDALTRRFEASVRVCQYNDGPNQRPRDLGNIIEQEAAIRAQLKAEGTALAS